MWYPGSDVVLVSSCCVLLYIDCLWGARSSSGCPANLRALDLALSEGHLSLHATLTICDPIMISSVV